MHRARGADGIFPHVSRRAHAAGRQRGGCDGRCADLRDLSYRAQRGRGPEKNGRSARRDDRRGAGLCDLCEFCPFPGGRRPDKLFEGRKNSCSLLGALLGFCVGYTLERKYIRFETKAVWWAQVLKVLGGAALLLAVKQGLKLLVRRRGLYLDRHTCHPLFLRGAAGGDGLAADVPVVRTTGEETSMNYAAIKTCDIANGPGVRTSLFVSGCTHHCKGCFQPETWDFSYGEPFTQDVIDTILHSWSLPMWPG